MSHRRNRTSHLRQPFVVTVALGTSAIGCGGTVSGDGGGGEPVNQTGGASAGGSLHGGGASAGAGSGGAATTTCPTVAPEPGTPCRVAPGVECVVGTDGCGSHTTATCTGGLWQVSWSGTSCNPPPPPSNVCPEREPYPGEYCNVTPGLTCSYGSCSGAPATEARCEGYSWQVSYWACNPPPPACPADVPMAEDPCDAWGSSYCYYDVPSDCGWASVEANCAGGQWSLHYAEGCPIDAGGPPDSGSPDGGTDG
jgi:hypothetical protein